MLPAASQCASCDRGEMAGTEVPEICRAAANASAHREETARGQLCDTSAKSMALLRAARAWPLEALKWPAASTHLLTAK